MRLIPWLMLTALFFTCTPGQEKTLFEEIEAGPWDTARQRSAIYAQCAENSIWLLNHWIEHKRDPETHLYSRGGQWNYHNEAADHYSSLVLMAYVLDPSLIAGGASLHKTLTNSIKMCTGPSGLPETYDLETGTRGEASIDQTAEWLRDGLIRIVEVLGADNDWYHELERLAELIIALGEKKGGLGKLVKDVETAGNLMQTYARLYTISGREKYIVAAEQIADFYLLNDPVETIGVVNFVDHGCELVPGLAEVFVVECKLKRPRAGLYHRPIRELLDRILDLGRHQESGLWYRSANLTDVGSHHNRNEIPPDTWGYVLFAFENYDRATGEQRYSSAIEKPMRWLVKNRPHFETFRNKQWPSSSTIDDWSDSYESMIVLWKRYPHITGIFEWLDWVTVQGKHRQAANIESGPYTSYGHFDGSTGRTLCLHMMLCSQGVRTIPFVEGLSLGGVQKDGSLYLVLGSNKTWKGKLCFDPPRTEHQTAAIDWARINEFPQWFVARPGHKYSVIIDGAGPVAIDGEQLIDGLELKLEPAEEIRILVKP